MEKSLRILLVEDEVVVSMCIEMELTRAGYTVCQQVITGEEAIKSVERENPDLILMDIRLAGDIDGIEAVQLIRKFSDIPIIFMTGFTDHDLEMRAKRLKPLGYFLKPVRLRELKPVIDAAFV